MTNFIRKSITRKIVLTLLTISLVPILFISIVNNQMSEQLRSEFLEQLAEQFDEKVLRLDGSIDPRAAQVNGVALWTL